MSSLVFSAFLQIAIGLALALLLIRTGVRRHRKIILKYWVLSWATLFLYSVSGLILLLIHGRTPHQTLAALVIVPAWFFERWPATMTLLGAILPLGLTVGIICAVLNGVRTSERRMNVFWESSHEGLVLIDAGGVILRANEAFCRIAGKSRQEVENRLFTVCLDPAEQESCLSRFRQAAAGGNIQPMHEIAFKLWDGSRRWLELTTALVDSKPSNTYVMNVREVTQRKQTEDALKESERRFRELLASVKLVGVILDANGNITYCNEYLQQLTGWTAEEVTGKNWMATFVPENNRASIEAVFSDIVEGKASAVHYENEIVTRDGASRMIHWTNTTLRDPDGRFVGCASLGTDVTAQKQLEERYRQSQKLESVGRLAGGIAHDFNNLLTVINGYSEVLLNGTDVKDPLHEGLVEIKRAGERASALTQQLLAFSRKQVLQPKLLDLNAVIGDASRMLRRLIGEDVDLMTRLDPKLGPVYADEGQIHQVLMNLAVNARDAMPNGGRLEISSANAEIDEASVDPLSGIQPGMYVAVSLADNGVGMNAETKSHLFEPFFTTKGRDKGTGLGLSTVYGIVRQSGGQITVTSEPGKGTTFRILLPRARDAELDPKILEADHVPRRGAETVLLVEDQPEVRKIAADTLRRFGYQVLEADSGEQALRISQEREQPIDLMITDLIMTGMTGRTLADQVRQTRPETRILYMSGYTDGGVVDQAKSASEAAYIQKPFTPHELAAKVGDCLARNLTRPRILVVDDELSIRLLMRRVLQKAGYEVVEAANGKAALAQIREGRVDLIITDLVMPEQEGVETIRRLRESHPQIKVVAMSGAFGGRLLQTASLFGAQATLMKPVSPATILQVTRELLRGN